MRGWLTRVAGTRFNQTLTYNAAVNGVTPAKALYNGNVSAMKWKSGDEPTERGYKFAYGGLNRLTTATYGEGAATASITYPNAFHFVDRANLDNEYTYDDNGNLRRDLNKNITLITYNELNLPSVVTFSNGNTVTYVYDGAGSKLSVAYKSGTTTTKTEYVGNKVYKNGTLSMILTGEGYATLTGSTPAYYYYLRDHQGNNRVVINQAGTVQQVNHYYPFGGLFGEGIQTSNQPYRYNGKEIDRFQSLDLLDYGARHYDAAIGIWTTPDPLSEKYFAVSPYVYVGNSPIIMIDPDGRRQWPVNETYNGHARRHQDNYGEPRGNRTHRGLDINLGSGSQDLGAPVYATHDGSVTRIATIDSGDINAGGNRVQITSDGGEVSTYYMHLNSITEGLEVGSNIVEGAQIGTLGGSGDGKSTRYTPHLHYELNIDGQRVNPVVSKTQLIDPQTRLTPIPLPEVTVTAQAAAARLPQVNVPEPRIPNIRLPEQKR